MPRIFLGRLKKKKKKKKQEVEKKLREWQRNDSTYFSRGMTIWEGKKKLSIRRTFGTGRTRNIYYSGT